MSSKKKDQPIQIFRMGLFSLKDWLINEPPKWLTDLAGSWTFYSILPSWPWPRATFDRIARFAPVIGFVIGIVQSFIWLSLDFLGWPKEGLALVVIAMEAWITGGLHLDGLIDTADGIGAGKARCLEAMEDSRIGSNGVLTLLIVLLLQISALIKLGIFAPIALPIAAFWSRFSPLWGISRFSYIRLEGSASFHKKNSQFRMDILPGVVILVVIFLILFNIPLFNEIKAEIIWSLFLCLIPTILIPELLGRKIGGYSGDTLGATQVISQSIILLMMAFIL